MAARMAQYVTIVDRSNKVIKQSSQFKDLFADAKSAYLARRAELKDKKRVREEAELQKAIQSVTLEERSVRGAPTRPRQTRRRSSEIEGRHRDSPPDYDAAQSGQARHIPLGDFNDHLYDDPPTLRRSPTSPIYRDPYTTFSGEYDQPRPLARAQTDMQLSLPANRPPIPRAYSEDLYDEDAHLAYGEHYPEDLIVNEPAPPQVKNQQELSSLVLKCKMLLDEADCAGHSAKAIVQHLQKNPDTMAQVGLILADISKILPRLAPGALATIGKSAPAVVALLLSSEFLIAVGVAAGVTVIAIGGYKIIKRMKEKASEKEDQKAEEAIDLRELEHVERWRRAIEPSAIDDGASVLSTTSVERELMTPAAARSQGYLPRTGESSQNKSSKSKDKEGERKRKHRRRRSDDGATSVSQSDTNRERRRRSISADENGSKAMVKVKKPSPLARMFSTS